MNSIQLVAVVVLFDPDVKKVIKNIESYAEQVDLLLLIDNSSKRNDEFLFYFKEICRTEYYYNNNNKGIAGALNLAIQIAQNEGFRYLLTMDQDSYFVSDSLKILKTSINKIHQFGILSSFHKNKFYTGYEFNNEIQEVIDVMTSGNILNLDVTRQIGGFNTDYFIDYVDIEYCLRLGKSGFKIFRINNSILAHSEGNIAMKKIIGRTVYPMNHRAERWYYKIRNYLYLKRQYGNYYSEYFKVEARNVRNSIVKILFFEKEKLKKIKMAIIGYLHYKKGIMGKY